MFNYSVFSVHPESEILFKTEENIMTENPIIFPKKVITSVAIIKK